MKTTRIVGGVLAAMLTLGLTTSAFAQNNDREANLQAMRWYAQQQMAQGLPNPYPGVNLWTGEGFFENQNRYYGNYTWGNPWGSGWNNPYQYQYGGYNPYYGWMGNPWF